MGNYLNKPVQKHDVKLLNCIRKVSIQDVEKVLKFATEQYTQQNTLIFNEFNEIFQEILGENVESLFLALENTHSIHGIVDIYESLAVLTLFSDEVFSNKVQFISKLFDMDSSGSLEIVELIMVFQTAIRSICKVVNIEIPTLNDIEEFTNKIYKDIDRDNDQIVSYDELSDWLYNQYSLQDFMLRYAIVQTYQNAKRRALQIFNNNKIDQNNHPILKEYIQQAIANYEFVLQRKHVSCQKVIDEINYAWASFNATDISGDGVISLREFPYLIYSYEGAKPKDIQLLFKSLDKDQNGELSLQEWFTYLKLNNAVKACENIVRRKFYEMDTDQTGILSTTDVCTLLADCFGQDLYDIHLKGFQEYFTKFDNVSLEQVIEFIDAPFFKIIQEQTDSIEQQPNPVEQQSELVEYQSEAVQEYSETVQEQSDPVQKQSEYGQEQPEIVQEQPDPVQEQSDPVQEQSDPVQEQSNPPLEQTEEQ